MALLPARVVAAEPAPRFDLRDGDRVVFIGDGLIEREQHHGWIELMLTARFPGRQVTFRNLGWNGDTPAGDSRFGLSLLQAGREPADEGWTQLVKQIEGEKPTVAVIGYGLASSFGGAAELEKFKRDYRRLLEAIEKVSPGVRLVLLSPVRHEALGGTWSDPAAHNAALERVTVAIQEIARERRAAFVSLFAGLRSPMQAAAGGGAGRLTDNGIHLNSTGYRVAAEAVEDALLGTAENPGWRTSAQTEALRQAILRKNEWYFHRSRPANLAYIFGFRKKEQGRNAAEVFQFDEFIAAEEARIARLRSLQPVEVTVPALRRGNLGAQLTPQPTPKFDVAEGLEVTLWAENPLLNKPIQMNFDPQGRLWVASSEVYPQIEPGQAPTDRILILEDTQGTGRADLATVFADGLLIPTGVEPGDGGVYVAQSTELLHFRDTDGDGKADVRRIVLSGFGTEDTHHNLHTLRWGLDGRLYMNQSVYTRTNTETPTGVVRLKAGGVFRFDPRDHQMEILYRGWVNTWGHQFDAFGQSFFTDGAGFQGVSWAIPGATYLTLSPARRTLQSISPGNYPKFCGLEFVYSSHFPEDWQGDLITCDFRAHRVVRFKVLEQDSGYVTKELPDVLRSTDTSFRPLDVKLGPDGALYLADWSNPIIQHGEVDFRDPRRDKEHGRIWRIAAKGRTPLARTDFTKLDTRALLDRLNSANRYDQAQAKRVLVERGGAQVEAELATWTARQTSPTARLQALWARVALRLPVDELATELTAVTEPRVRAAAVRVLPTADSLPKLRTLVADQHPRVRVEAVRALGKLGTVEAADAALTVLTRPMDPFLNYALWLTINELATPWLAAVQSGTWRIEGREAQLEFGLNAVEAAQAGSVLGQLLARRGLPRDGSGPWIELIGTAGGPAEARLAFEAVLGGGLPETVAIRALNALAGAARLRDVVPSGDRLALRRLLENPSEKMRIAALPLLGLWKLSELAPIAVRLAGDAATPPTLRSAALAALRDLGGAEVLAEIRRLAQPTSPPAIRREAALALGSIDLARAIPEIMAVLAAIESESDAQAFWRSLLAIKGAAARLAAEVPKANLPKSIAQAGLRPAREGAANQPLVEALIKAAGLVLSEVKLSPAELQKLGRDALALGDAARGERIYRKAELACQACHAIGGAGGKVGPDLTSMGASAPVDYLVESLLYPNAKIKEGYHSVMISTNDRQELSGMVTRETDTELLLRTASNEVISIPVKNIAKRTNVGSLMPAGLIDTLLPEERLDLIKFLSELGKPGAFDAAKGGVARVWSLYRVVVQNQSIGIDRVVRGDPTLADWETAYSLVNGALPRSAYAVAANSQSAPRGFYVATRFQAARAGTVKLNLTGKVVGAWLNGRPQPASSVLAGEAVAGANVLVLQLDETKLPEEVRLTSADVNFLSN